MLSNLWIHWLSFKPREFCLSLENCRIWYFHVLAICYFFFLLNKETGCWIWISMQNKCFSYYQKLIWSIHTTNHRWYQIRKKEISKVKKKSFVCNNLIYFYHSWPCFETANGAKFYQSRFEFSCTQVIFLKYVCSMKIS